MEKPADLTAPAHYTEREKQIWMLGYHAGVGDVRRMKPSAGYTNQSTSKAAADKIRPKLTGKRREVFDYIKFQGEKGATASEIIEGTGLLPYTARPRCSELRDAGHIVDSGFERSNENGSPEIVWVHPHFSLKKGQQRPLI